MKKTLTFVVALLLSVGLMAQKDVIPVHKNAVKQKVVKGTQPYQSKFIKLKSLDNTKDVPVGTPIGLTNYDLQSNSAVARRMLSFDNGRLSATWIQYQGSSLPSAPERGSGYAYFDGTSWQYAEMTGNETVEGSTRAGWPAMMTNGTDEFVVSHYRSGGGLFGHYQTIGAAGSNWASNDLTGGPEAMLWPRAASAGDYYYVVAVDDFNSSASEIEGLHFYRSSDAGQNWEYLGLMPGFTDHYANGNGDQYAIDAYDSIVAVAYFGGFADLVVWKSTDHGDTWDTIVVNDFPVDGYDPEGGTLIDMDNDGTADTLISTDNTGDIIIDKDGKVHVVFGRMRLLDEDASDGQSSYFPYTDYLLYWNEDMGEGVWADSMVTDNSFDMAVPDAVDTIGWSFDLNGDDTIWQFADGGGGWPFGTYYTSLTTFATLATDSLGRIYCAFTTVMEGDDYVKTDANPNAQSYRGAWIRVRDTNGVWLDPVDISSVDGTNAENVFPSLARNVDHYCDLQLQWDNEPGLNIRGDEDPATDNYIIAKHIPISELGIVDTITNISNIVNNISLKVSPNPASDYITISGVNNADLNIYNTVGELLFSAHVNSDNATLNITDLPLGTYIIRANTENGVGSAKFVKVQ